MSLPPSYLRTYYRQRTNPRMSTAIQAGTIRNYECDVGTRWHTYAFTGADIGKTLKVYATSSSGRTANTFTLEIDGYTRTETTGWNGETWSVASTDQTWYLCYVYEHPTVPGGVIPLGNSELLLPSYCYPPTVATLLLITHSYFPLTLTFRTTNQKSIPIHPVKKQLEHMRPIQPFSLRLPICP